MSRLDQVNKVTKQYILFFHFLGEYMSYFEMTVFLIFCSMANIDVVTYSSAMLWKCSCWTMGTFNVSLGAKPFLFSSIKPRALWLAHAMSNLVVSDLCTLFGRPSSCDRAVSAGSCGGESLRVATLFVTCGFTLPVCMAAIGRKHR